jgi:hypothetical protein
MPSRAWVKIYCDKWLSGTIREETPLCRSVWVDLITLAGSGRYGDTGIIQLSEAVGMTDEQIAAILHITLNDWLTTKQRLRDTGRISFNGSNIIAIINWQKYQSEYQRQRGYRELQPKVTTESYLNKLQPEVTPESDAEKRREEKENRIDNNVSITKKRDNKPISFEVYQEELKKRFPKLNFELELEKFNTYWSEGKRELKRPKTALLNWITRAEEYRLEREKNGKPRTNQAGYNQKQSKPSNSYKESIGKPLI